MAKQVKKNMKKLDNEVIFDNLKKLFKADDALSYVNNKKLNINQIGNAGKEFETNLSRNNNSLNSFGGIYSNKRQIHSLNTVNRRLRYRDYEVMDQDSLVSSALDIYAEECTLKTENDTVLVIKSEKEEIKDELDRLFYNVLNYDFNAFPWSRNLCKYGDFFLVIEIAPGEGIVNAYPFSVYEIEREEKPIEQGERTGKNKTIFKLIGSNNNNISKNELANFEVIHFRLLSDTNFLPYGKSVIEGGRRVWKQLKLMEDAMMVYRIMRAPERRIFYVNVGNLPVKDIDQWMEKFTSRIKKEQIIDRTTGELDLKYNVQNTLEDFFFPVRGDEKATRVDTLPGGQNMDRIEDINYLLDKVLASWKIPKSYLQYSDESIGKSNLAMEDIRFARTIERVQKVIEAELRKVALIHLYSTNKFEETDLLNFEISLAHSSNLREQQEMEILGQKLDILNNSKDNSVLPSNYFYKTLFNFTDNEINEIWIELMKDAKRKYVLEQLETEGLNPLDPAEKEEIESEEDEENDVDVNVDDGSNDDETKQSEPEEKQTKDEKEPVEKNVNKSEVNFKDVNTDLGMDNLTPKKDATEYDSKRVKGYKPKINANNELGIILKALKNSNGNKVKNINEKINFDNILNSELRKK